MADVTSEVQVKLEEIRQKYKSQLPQKINRIRTLWFDYCENELNTEYREEIQLLLHEIIGSAGSLGAMDLSEYASRIKERIEQITNIHKVKPSSVRMEVNSLIEEMMLLASSWETGVRLNESADRHLIYSYLNNDSTDEILIKTLKENEFIYKRIKSLEDLEQAIKIHIPAVLIIEINFDKADCEQTDSLINIVKAIKKHTRVIALSESSQISTKLKAVSFGIDRYLPKPYDSRHIKETITNLIDNYTTSPYRVLLLDDPASSLKKQVEELKSDGILVEYFTDAMSILDRADRFNPDVTAINGNVKDFSTTDIVRVIRLEDKWSMMPIVFIKDNINANNETEKADQQNEKFISSSISPDKMVTSLITIADQSRRVSHLNNKMRKLIRENEFELVTMNEHDIVSITDVRGVITSVNEKFCNISGYSREELLGGNHRMLKSGLHPAEFYKEMWRTISSGKVWSGMICNRKKDGREYWVESTIVPFLNEKGKPYKYVSARTDVTALRESEERLNRSQSFANIGTWDWNIRTGDLFWSDRIWPLFGYQKEVIETTYENFLNAVHKEDKEKVIEAVNKCIENGDPYSIEHRVIWPDGSVHWVHESGDVVRDYDGNAIHMLGVVQDINERKEIDISLAKHTRLLNEAQCLAKIGNWEEDIISGEIFWSNEIYNILGYEPGKVKPSNETFFSVLDAEEKNKAIKSKSIAQKNGNDEITLRIITPDNTSKYVHQISKAEYNQHGELIKLNGTLQDVTERVETSIKDKKQKDLVDFLHSSTRIFVERADFKEAMDNMLKTLLSLTKSEYGFTGEVFYDDDNKPYLITHSITNIAWDSDSMDLYERTKNIGFEFRNLNTLFGHAIVTQDVVISNDPLNDPRSGGLPAGHPELKAFLGVPVFYGNEMVGMYGIANRPGGYDTETLDYLKPFNITYGAMIHSKRMMDREKLHKENLLKAKVEAENANRAKSQFLSSMSHELRTPMNAILGFSQLLNLESDNLNDSQKENIEEISKAGGHLLNLINEVLDLAKIESGHIDLSIESILVREVLHECLQLTKPLVDKKNISVILKKNNKIISQDSLENINEHVLADRTRLRQVILNLLSNAIKYNVDNGKIIIQCDIVGSNYKISIKDTGKGISRKYKDNLFVAFNRLDAEQSNIEGTGIGLVITKNLIELMNGTISFDSIEGVGSTFSIEIPYDSEVKVDCDSNKSILCSLINQPENNENRFSILYIEDNPANLRLVKQTLERLSDVYIWSAHEPLLGLELAVEHKPDLILLDINLPGINGFELLKLLQNNRETTDIPVIAISANAMNSDIKKGLNAGFDRYLIKPLDLSELINIVTEKIIERNLANINL